MKIANMSKTALFCVSLLGLAIPCMANEIPVSGNHTQKIQQAEAIVVHIDQNNVTLQAVEDKDKKMIAPFSNAAEFKVGDKVVLEGNTLKKSDSSLTDVPQPHDATSGVEAAPTGNKM